MKSYIVICICTLLHIAGESSFAQPGQTGFTFLKLGVGARSLAMGEASITLSSDPSGTYYNPATLSLAARPQLLLMHKAWVQDITTEYVAAATYLGDLAVAVSINSMNINNIELRDQPGPSQGTFDAHDVALGFSVAYKVDSTLSAGLTTKYLYEKILVQEASGVGFDFGLLYLTPWNIRVGAAFCNVGSVNALDVESSQLPKLIRVGASYVHPLESIDGSFSVASDVVVSGSEDKNHVNFGSELNYHRAFAVRAGYQTGYDARGITAGVGIQNGIFRFDYAFIPTRYDLGSTHTFSVGIEFQ